MQAHFHLLYHRKQGVLSREWGGDRVDFLLSFLAFVRVCWGGCLGFRLGTLGLRFRQQDPQQGISPLGLADH